MISSPGPMESIGFAFAPRGLPQVLDFFHAQASSLVATTPVDSETSKRGGCTWQPIDLSEARGLMLCWVIRGGMRDFTEAKVPVALVRLQALGMLTLEPERLKNRLATTREES